MGEYKILTGNEAITHGALAVGMNFFAGYPITPATEIAELSSELLPKRGGKYIQMEDELASIAAIIGASAAGAKSMTATSGPGFALMQENLGYAVVAEIPIVVIDVMRQGPCQGAPTAPAQGDFMMSRWASHGNQSAIVLVPNSVAEAYSEIQRAFAISETLRTPVTVLSDATLAHMSEKVFVPADSEIKAVNRKKPTCPIGEYKPFNQNSTDAQPLAAFGDGYRWSTSGLLHDDVGFPTPSNEAQLTVATDHLVDKINAHKSEIESYEEYMTEDAEIIVLSAGTVSRTAKKAVQMAREAGIKVGLFRPITLWPFPSERFNQIAAGRDIISCEMNSGQLSEIAAAFADRDRKSVAVTQNNGSMLRVEKIFEAIKEVK